MSNRHLVVNDDDVPFNEYRKTSKGKVDQSNNDDNSNITIDEVIQFCNSNKKDKDVRVDTKELLLEYLDRKYSNYEPQKKKRK